MQQQTFRYFWEGAEPTSGMARERTSSGATVTTGGTGFGVMAMAVAAERGFVTRSEACQRVQRIVTFLAERATSYHGAFSHWIDGQTGQTLPFSADDNGADLVETGLLFQGLLTARAYFDGADAAESKLRADITALWEAVEWDFFTKEGTEKVLYWHWSPDKGWAMNMPIQGWNEALIVYVLAASSPTHPIGREVYAEGWARGGAMRNGQVVLRYRAAAGRGLRWPPFLGPLFLPGAESPGTLRCLCRLLGAGVQPYPDQLRVLRRQPQGVCRLRCRLLGTDGQRYSRRLHRLVADERPGSHRPHGSLVVDALHARRVDGRTALLLL